MELSEMQWISISKPKEWAWTAELPVSFNLYISQEIDSKNCWIRLCLFGVMFN
jgi:hypothetical protein